MHFNLATSISLGTLRVDLQNNFCKHQFWSTIYEIEERIIKPVGGTSSRLVAQDFDEKQLRSLVGKLKLAVQLSIARVLRLCWIYISILAPRRRLEIVPNTSHLVMRADRNFRIHGYIERDKTCLQLKNVLRKHLFLNRYETRFLSNAIISGNWWFMQEECLEKKPTFGDIECTLRCSEWAVFDLIGKFDLQIATPQPPDENQVHLSIDCYQPLKCERKKDSARYAAYMPRGHSGVKG